jgi:hypothetical protein
MSGKRYLPARTSLPQPLNATLRALECGSLLPLFFHELARAAAVALTFRSALRECRPEGRRYNGAITLITYDRQLRKLSAIRSSGTSASE